MCSRPRGMLLGGIPAVETLVSIVSERELDVRRTDGNGLILLFIRGDLDPSSFGVVAPGDLGSGNSASSNVGESTLGARSRTATARGCWSSIGRIDACPDRVVDFLPL